MLEVPEAWESFAALSKAAFLMKPDRARLAFQRSLSSGTGTALSVVKLGDELSLIPENKSVPAVKSVGRPPGERY